MIMESWHPLFIERVGSPKRNKENPNELTVERFRKSIDHDSLKPTDVKRNETNRGKLRGRLRHADAAAGRQINWQRG